MRIKVEKPSAETISEMQGCPTWSKETSVFDWEYGATETCYVMDYVRYPDDAPEQMKRFGEWTASSIEDFTDLYRISNAHANGGVAKRTAVASRSPRLLRE